MKPVIGSAPEIIAQAMALGILCRPVEPGWCGEALEPRRDGFRRIEAWTTNLLGDRVITPHQILLDWTLITKELLEKECEEAHWHGF